MAFAFLIHFNKTVKLYNIKISNGSAISAKKFRTLVTRLFINCVTIVMIMFIQKNDEQETITCCLLCLIIDLRLESIFFLFGKQSAILIIEGLRTPLNT